MWTSRRKTIHLDVGLGFELRGGSFVQNPDQFSLGGFDPGGRQWFPAVRLQHPLNIHQNLLK